MATTIAIYDDTNGQCCYRPAFYDDGCSSITGVGSWLAMFGVDVAGKKKTVGDPRVPLGRSGDGPKVACAPVDDVPITPLSDVGVVQSFINARAERATALGVGEAYVRDAVEGFRIATGEGGEIAPRYGVTGTEAAIDALKAKFPTITGVLGLEKRAGVKEFTQVRNNRRINRIADDLVCRFQLKYPNVLNPALAENVALARQELAALLVLMRKEPNYVNLRNSDARDVLELASILVWIPPRSRLDASNIARSSEFTRTLALLDGTVVSKAAARK